MSSSSASATSNSSSRYSFFSGLLLGGVLIGGIAGAIYWLGFRQTPDRLIQQGQAALSQRDWLRAVDLGEKAVRLVPDSTAAWKLLAEAAFRHGDLDRSLTAVQQSSRAPSSEIAKLAVKLGSEFMKRNRIPEARSMDFFVIIIQSNRIINYCEYMYWTIHKLENNQLD